MTWHFFCALKKLSLDDEIKAVCGLSHGRMCYTAGLGLDLAGCGSLHRKADKLVLAAQDLVARLGRASKAGKHNDSCRQFIGNTMDSWFHRELKTKLKTIWSVKTTDLGLLDLNQSGRV